MNRISTETSTIFLAKVDNRAVGFTQLYSSFCSVDASPIIILYDLFVDSASRQSGVGKALMDRAKDYAKQIGASRLDLETENTNVNAQRLYESLGYEKKLIFISTLLRFRPTRKLCPNYEKNKRLRDVS